MKMIGGMRCEEALARLWEFLDDELPPVDQVAVRKHLEICTRCYPKYDFQRAYFRFLHQINHRDRVAAEVRRRLFERLLAQEA